MATITKLDIPLSIDRAMFIPGRGCLLGFPFRPGESSDESTGVPTDAIAGFAPGALFFNVKAAGGTAIYTNLGTANSASWSLLNAAGGAGNSTFSNGIAVTGGNVVLTGGVNVKQNSLNGTGTQYGTSPFHNQAFYGNTPISQPASVSQNIFNGSLTNNGTLFASGNAIIDSNIGAVASVVGALRTALVNLGLIKGSA